MDVTDYREQYAAQIEQGAQRRAYARARSSRARPAAAGSMGLTETAGLTDTDTDDVSAALDVIRDQAADVDLRVSALRDVSIAIGKRHNLIDMTLELLRDAAQPAALRKAALSVLQQSSFRATVFAAKRAEYLDTLRSIVDDKDAELRRRAIGVLAREQDEYVQRRLLEGLEDPSKALVPAAKAIQFLGYDIHAEYFPILRRIVQHPPNRAAKKEAVRLLAADPSSKDLLADLLKDKSESSEVRNISAVALQSLAPDEFEEQAKRIVLDDDEDDRLRATCMSALAHFANPALSEDAEFTQRVEELRDKSASPQLKRATTSYTSKYSP